MKKQAIISLILGCAIVFSMQSAVAADVLQMSTVIEKLQAKGYPIIRKIVLKENAYKAEVINAVGNEMEVRVNAESGEILESAKNSKRLSMLDAVKKVEAGGYHDVSKVKLHHNQYEITAHDKNNKKVELEVNIKTGKMGKDWF